MKALKYILLLFAIVLPSLTMAETIVLRSGQSIQGEIILQNEEIIIIKTKEGIRYQYPISEIQTIQQDSQTSNTNPTPLTAEQSPKKVAIRAQAYGGAVYTPQRNWGGQIGLDLQIGTKAIKDFPIFVGGSIGYNAKLYADQTYSYIPLQVVVSSPLTTHTHAPHIAMNLGYGFSTHKDINGGICIGTSAGWQYKFKPNATLILSAYVQWQQTQMDITETINDTDYINKVGCNFVALGTVVTLQF